MEKVGRLGETVHPLFEGWKKKGKID